MFKRLTIAAAAAFVMSAGLASAADMPVKGGYAAPYNWTGLYAGVNGGYAWVNQSGATGNGGFGGGQLGYNWQINSIVFGLEADIQAGSIKGTGTATSGGLTITETAKASYFGTARVRVGLAVDRFMPYVTGGLAYTNIKHDGFGVVGVTGAYSASNTLAGYALGGGVEMALWDRWTVKGEYLYMNFPGSTNNYATTTPPIAVTYTRPTVSVARLGLNYRF